MQQVLNDLIWHLYVHVRDNYRYANARRMRLWDKSETTPPIRQKLWQRNVPSPLRRGTHSAYLKPDRLYSFWSRASKKIRCHCFACRTPDMGTTHTSRFASLTFTASFACAS